MSKVVKSKKAKKAKRDYSDLMLFAIPFGGITLGTLLGYGLSTFENQEEIIGTAVVEANEQVVVYDYHRIRSENDGTYVMSMPNGDRIIVPINNSYIFEGDNSREDANNFINSVYESYDNVVDYTSNNLKTR